MSMGAADFYENFRTETPRLSTVEAVALVQANECISIKQVAVRGKLGLTVYGDVKNTARDLDAQLDELGANAYVVEDFEWVPVGAGATQLVVSATALACVPEGSDQGQQDAVDTQTV